LHFAVAGLSTILGHSRIGSCKAVSVRVPVFSIAGECENDPDAVVALNPIVDVKFQRQIGTVYYKSLNHSFSISSKWPQELFELELGLACVFTKDFDSYEASP
jgi:hypothetical protein